jgi:hypothetical protein
MRIQVDVQRQQVELLGKVVSRPLQGLRLSGGATLVWGNMDLDFCGEFALLLPALDGTADTVGEVLTLLDDDCDERWGSNGYLR